MINYKKFTEIEKCAIKDYITELVNVGGVKNLKSFVYFMDVTEIAKELLARPISDTDLVLLSFDKNRHLYDRRTERTLMKLSYEKGNSKIIDIMFNSLVDYMINGMVLDYFSMVVYDTTTNSIVYEISDEYSETPRLVVTKIFMNGLEYVSNYDKYIHASSYNCTWSGCEAIQYIGINRKEIVDWCREYGGGVIPVFEFTDNTRDVIRFRNPEGAITVRYGDYLVKLENGENAIVVSENVFDSVFSKSSTQPFTGTIYYTTIDDEQFKSTIPITSAEGESDGLSGDDE